MSVYSKVLASLPQAKQDVLRNAKLLLMDLDGTLTDGRIILFEGEERASFFSIRDGWGMQKIKNHGVQLGIITGSVGRYVEERAERLKVDYLYAGNLKKLECLDDLLKKTQFSAKDIVYVGDDYPDIPVMQAVGFGAAVGDALPKVKEAADIVLETNGGFGAVRELIELMREARGVEFEL